ncbi:hypothetical protein MBLNU457_4411t1 [Dothideomycetes sp. NU457]
MSSARSNVGNPNRAVKPTVAPGRSTASPLTPKLAANNTTNKRPPSPKRPFFRAPTSSGTRSPSPTKDATPTRPAVGDAATPRSTARSTVRGGSTASTPTSGTQTTPDSLRAKSPPIRPHLAGYATPTTRGAQNGTPAPFVRKAGNTGEVARSSPLARVAPAGPVDQPGIDAIMNDKSPLFFHASDVRNEQPAQRPPPPKKMPTFVYANGREEEQVEPSRTRALSPAGSAISERRTPGPPSSIGPASNRALSPPLVSPALSSVSSNRSPLFPTSDAKLQASRPLSPPVVATPNTAPQTSNNLSVPRLRPLDGQTKTPVSTPSPANGLGPTIERKGSVSSISSPSRHGKSASVSAAPPESPSLRKRSATWAEKRKSSETKTVAAIQFPALSPNLSKADPSSMPTSPMIGSPTIPQSPSREKPAPDFAADARRERKVLDLEISNSSLLAINRSLEREVKKQKAELKRFRRLSRAGHLNAAPIPTAHELDLPEISTSASRPSSPFEEDVSDMLSSSSESEDNDTTSTTSQDAAVLRAKDEERIRRDLRKHRELILDTARMNRSLQRCLTWTEDLIKDGKKALDHAVRSEEVRLGGRILSEDDESVTRPSTAAATEAGTETETEVESVVADDEEARAEDMSGVEAFLGLGPWRNEVDAAAGGEEGTALSMESPRTDRDSGIEIQKIRKCSRSPVPRTEAAAAVLRGSLGETF